MLKLLNSPVDSIEKLGQLDQLTAKIGKSRVGALNRLDEFLER